MTPSKLKRHLQQNPHIIIEVLSSLGCHSIKHTPNIRVSAANPDGDNPMAIQVLLENDNLTTINHTRIDYEGGDIYSYVEYANNCDFHNAFKHVANIAGCNCSYEEKPQSLTYSFLNKLSCSVESNVVKNKPLSENILDNYIKASHIMFAQDYITLKAQEHFQIAYDIKDSRILIPIRDLWGNIVTLKGRTTKENFKEKGIPKYVAYYPYHARDILFGYYENYWNILHNREVILVESEKSVMQGWGYGQKNMVALAKKRISSCQLETLIKLNVDIVLALDNDVPLEELKYIAKPFKGLANVYYIKDTKGFLGEKDAPTDKGIGVWEELYNSKKLIKQ